ncbi:MAG: alginate export family protein [Pseudomonadota bacterium]
MRSSTLVGLGRLAIAAGLVVGAVPGAQAQEPSFKLYEGGGLTLNMDLTVAFGAFSVGNANFGIGSVGLNGTRKGGRQWTEGFVIPSLLAEFDFGEGGSLYGNLSAVGAATRGDGEGQALSGTSNRPERLEVENAVLGWKSGKTFEALGEDAIDISAGRQSFTVGDGFLIIDGTVDGFGRAAYYLGPRAAFEKTAILKINTEPVRADLFHLASRTDQRTMRANDVADSDLYGANIEWFQSAREDRGRADYDARQWYVGATAMRIYKADSTGPGSNFSFAGGGTGGAQSANRDGLGVYSLRLGGAFLSALPGLKLYGEAAIQRNGATDRKVRAGAWYAEPQYQFDLPWAPRLSYRYAHFSGDPNPADRTDKSWDPLFNNTGPRGIGTWAHGEIYSQYVGANSNVNVNQVHLRMTPLDNVLDIGLVLYRFAFAEQGQVIDPVTGVAIRSDQLMDEANLYAQWTTPIENLSVLGALGVGRPGTGMKQSLGAADRTDRSIYLGEVTLTYKF